MTASGTVSRSPSDFLGVDGAVMTVQEEGQDKCPEKEDNVDDCQGKRGLEHGAVFIDVDRPRGPAAAPIVAKWTKIDIDGTRGEAGTVGSTDASQVVDSSDQGTDKAQVNEGDKKRISSGRAEAE